MAPIIPSIPPGFDPRGQADAAAFDGEAVREPFKQSMRLLASSVAVITTVVGGNRSGLTATAVCSLTMDPPMLLVCVNRSSRTHPAIEAAGAFCVNILANGHADIAGLFANSRVPMDEKFTTGNWTEGSLGLPVLNDGLAAVECIARRRIDEGTHTIFLGEVRSVSVRHECEPLLYARQRFGRVDYLA